MAILNSPESIGSAQTQLDQYGGSKAIPCSAGAKPHFYTEKINNRWWLCTPAGNAFFMKGVYNVDMNDTTPSSDRADATALPFAEGAADVVATSLTLHHLEPDGVVAALREMAAAARCAVVVNDLLRTHLALALVWLVTRLLRCHPISRHDGPLSVRRAYSSAELRALGALAGIERLEIREYRALGRLVAVTG